METVIDPATATDFVKAQMAFGPALKTSTNPHFKTKYADLSACIEAVLDALHANGFALMQRTFEYTEGISVETVFIHKSGNVIESGVLNVPAIKTDPQAYGSALTYARRYSLMAACGIAPEDDDGQGTQASMSNAEVAWLSTLQAAAKNGTEALKTAFEGIPNGPLKVAFWAKHQKALKEVANGKQ